MTPTDPDRPYSDAGAGTPPSKRLAGLLAAMHASLVEASDVFILEVEPLPPVEAIDAWQRRHGLRGLDVLVLRPNGATTPAEVAAEAGVPVLETLDDGAITVASSDLRRLMAAAPKDLLIVLVDGPVEPADETAVAGAIERGRSPLHGDLRALLALTVIGAHAVRLETRERAEAVAFAADGFARYLAGVAGDTMTTLHAPEADLVDRVLDRTGRMAVRPIETEIYSTAIDVGISTWPTGEVRPADTSLIYDLYSGTWHGD